MRESPIDLKLFSKAKVRRVTQTALAECGLACLSMVASFHQLEVDLNSLRRKFQPSSRGVTLNSLMAMADQMGLSPRAVQLDLDGLSSLHLPAILHWDMAHFVVVEQVKSNKALVHDPGGLSKWMPFEEISKHFTGVGLELEPLSNFERGNYREKLKLTDLWTRIRGAKSAIAQVVVLSLLLQLFALAAPYFVQLSVDLALANNDVSLLLTLAGFFAAIALLVGFTQYLRASVLLSIGSLFGTGLSSNISRRLFRLPIDWFYRRHLGDILSRFQSVTPIRKLLAEDAPATLVDGLLVLLTLIVMSLYSVWLAAISLAAAALVVLVRLLIFYPQKSAQEDMLIANGREQSVLIETLRGIRSLRLSGQSTARHALWRSRLVEAVNATIKHNRLDNGRLALQVSILGIENVATIALAIHLVMIGQLTIGMAMAFLAYKVMFFQGFANLLDRFFELKMLGLHLERLADIVLSDEDPGLEGEGQVQTAFRGEIELRNIKFRYGKADPYVLNGINLVVRSGESVAITGPSGGGKSTLAHIILGLFEPTEGDVLIDQTDLKSFGYQNYQKQTGAVLQDDTLFAGSLGENITMFDDTPDMDRLIEAASAAAIFEDIRRMPMGFDTLVGDMGNALSGGQQQRVMLARALYRKPRILVLDEATSHLDIVNEKRVNDYIEGLGITRIIIAHREDTIAMADRIVELENGEFIERTNQVR